jgi:small subunit ribosomal protein S16
MNGRAGPSLLSQSRTILGSTSGPHPNRPLPDTEFRWEKTTAVAVKIKLKRLGKIRAPYYRIVVADARTKRDGRAIEEIGKYHPKAEPSFIEVNSERAQHWLAVGAQPTDPVRKILEITGDWQKFKGLPGAEGTLRVPETRADRKAAFAAALQETLEDGSTTSKAKSRAKSGDSAGSKGARSGKADKADAGKAEKAEKPEKAETAKADKPEKAETAKADKPEKAETAKADKPEKAEAGKTEKAESGKTETAKSGQSGKSGRPDKGGKADKGTEEATADAAAATTAPPAGDAADDSASSEG